MNHRMLIWRMVMAMGLLIVLNPTTGVYHHHDQVKSKNVVDTGDDGDTVAPVPSIPIPFTFTPFTVQLSEARGAMCTATAGCCHICWW
jgi:hypothetical protein